MKFSPDAVLMILRELQCEIMVYVLAIRVSTSRSLSLRMITNCQINLPLDSDILRV